jgi:hypothetical protein
MPTLVQHIIVDASADAVWEVIGRRFDRIGEWATAVPSSTAVPHSTCPVDGAPVAGRVCDTGIRLMPRVTESIVAFDDTARSLTYRADDLPAFVAVATNTWTVAVIDQDRSRVSVEARFETWGWLGAVARWLILRRVGRTGRYLAEDLRHYVEHGTASPRKRAALSKSR